jgi:Flp pilus assembly protein TadG
VELAITLPVLLLVAFTAIELFNLVALRQLAFRVAFDAARMVSQRDLSDADAIAFAEQQLADKDFSGEVLVDAQPSLQPEFEQVTIRVTAQVADNFSFVRFGEGMFTTGQATSTRWIRSAVNPPPVTKKTKGKGHDRKK